ncbi:hypothetical protein QBC37DRAFT_109445 [Rhypophila decipiens]|uniref:Uncharacterized protein n=1 Tax=Rhypophila decipiens TaxID=261697 RepID=A0AAN6YHY6_9PEZI|nr:hypothetical protein QBC37DRAFT_109445 [Rhypophila decipiens]
MVEMYNGQAGSLVYLDVTSIFSKYCECSWPDRDLCCHSSQLSHLAIYTATTRKPTNQLDHRYLQFLYFVCTYAAMLCFHMLKSQFSYLSDTNKPASKSHRKRRRQAGQKSVPPTLLESYDMRRRKQSSSDRLCRFGYLSLFSLPFAISRSVLSVVSASLRHRQLTAARLCSQQFR